MRHMRLNYPGIHWAIIKLLDNRDKAVVVVLMACLLGVVIFFLLISEIFTNLSLLDSDVRENHIALLMNQNLAVLALQAMLKSATL